MALVAHKPAGPLLAVFARYVHAWFSKTSSKQLVTTLVCIGYCRSGQGASRQGILAQLESILAGTVGLGTSAASAARAAAAAAPLAAPAAVAAAAAVRVHCPSEPCGACSRTHQQYQQYCGRGFCLCCRHNTCSCWCSNGIPDSL